MPLLTLEQSHALQRQFAAHVRNPDQHRAPKGLDPKGTAAYCRLFFETITAFIDETYRVLAQVMGEQWRPLERQFYEQFSAQSPYFHRISNEFLLFITSTARLKPALIELACYEQLLFDSKVIDPLQQPTATQSEQTVFASEPQLIVRAGLLLEGFEYNILGLLNTACWQDSFAEKIPSPQFFAFYRDGRNNGRVVHLSPITAMLLQQFEKPTTPLKALQAVAQATHVTLESILDFGLEFIDQSIGETLIFAQYNR